MKCRRVKQERNKASNSDLSRVSSDAEHGLEAPEERGGKMIDEEEMSKEWKVFIFMYPNKQRA